ncbi:MULTISPECIES: NAD(P)H oxidoreductase [Chelativorans]|jgi:putative NADPH-quinone reductase|uniref:NAD(P)H dehydrogenase (Quinone) n=1 Tax=Chelativorans sp. (strain BNC1) TaxID=266779 RepID=Q11D53_CHESB|nr:MULTISPECIES: NAD(P)H oxidoreductase [Chelativorans]
MDDSTHSPRIHIIWAHPRRDSLTGRVVNAISTEAQQLGMKIVELDLYRSGFDPVLEPEDEPDFTNPHKRYSDEVLELAGSLTGSDAAIIVFPVWWYSLPAMLKGYIDRVWNYGLLYGNGKRLPFSAIRWVALVGGGETRFVREHKDRYMEDLLNDGIAIYCGVENSTVTFLYNTLAYEEEADLSQHHQVLIEQARSVVRELNTGFSRNIERVGESAHA